MVRREVPCLALVRTCGARSMAFHQRYRPLSEGGNYRKFFPQRVSRASARRHRKTVFPHLFRLSLSSTFYVLFSENGSTVFPPPRRFTQTVPRLWRTVLTLSCWIQCTARSSLLCWSTHHLMPYSWATSSLFLGDPCSVYMTGGLCACRVHSVKDRRGDVL